MRNSLMIIKLAELLMMYDFRFSLSLSWPHLDWADKNQ